MEEKHRVTLKIKWLIMVTVGITSVIIASGCEAYPLPMSAPQDMTVTTLAAYDPAHPFDDLPAQNASCSLSGSTSS